jgi:hypothetical protein
LTLPKANECFRALLENGSTEEPMNMKHLIVAAIAVSSLALAAPSFSFSKDVKMNGMMGTMGGKDVIELAAVPGLALKAKNISAKQATFIYTTTEKTYDKDSHTVFDFYAKALVSEGWKSAGMMGSAMADGGMAKPADGTTKPADGTMAKPADGAMMKKSVTLQEKFTLKTNTILVTTTGVKDRVEIDLELK